MIPALKGAKLASAAVKIYKDIEAKRSAAAGKIKAQETKPRWKVPATRDRLQHTYKHAKDFGVEGNANNKTLAQLRKSIQKHVDQKETQIIEGTYHNKEVTHHYNPNTKLNVIKNKEGELVTGFKLKPRQATHIELNGKLGGGR